MLFGGCAMPSDGKFGVFSQGENGPLWKGFFDDLDEAKVLAQELANRERLESFIYEFQRYSEIARFSPARTGPSTNEG